MFGISLKAALRKLLPAKKQPPFNGYQHYFKVGDTVTFQDEYLYNGFVNGERLVITGLLPCRSHIPFEPIIYQTEKGNLAQGSIKEAKKLKLENDYGYSTAESIVEARLRDAEEGGE